MTVSEQIIQVLDALAKQFGIVVDWSQQNLLPYIEEISGKLVAYEYYTSIAWIYIAIGILIIAVMVFPIAKKIDDDIIVFFAAIALICSIVALIIVVSVQTFDIIACKHFPEKVILDYLETAIQSRR